MVSYARSTYAKAKKFQEKLEELQKTIQPATIRAYLFTKQEQNVENVAEKLQLSEEQIALAQAEKNGIFLSEEIVSGEAIFPSIDKELLKKVPSLGVYNLFLLFTKEELDTKG